jgi:hypothetical protein
MPSKTATSSLKSTNQSTNQSTVESTIELKSTNQSTHRSIAESTSEVESTEVSTETNAPIPPKHFDSENTFRCDNVIRDLKKWIAVDKQSGDRTEKQVHLFRGDCTTERGKLALIEVWGDKESELMHKFFTAAFAMGQRLFKLQDTSHVPDGDSRQLVLVKCLPNEYQERYDMVYKLQTKGKKLGKSILIKESFPKPVAWKEGMHFRPDGTPVKHPKEWTVSTVDDSNIDLNELLALATDEAPLKKQKI